MQAQRDSRRGSTTERGYGWGWQQAAAETKAAHLALYGAWCPGWERDGHQVTAEALTVDHIIPKAQGGSDHPSNRQVLCQPCNSAKGARTGR